MNLRTLAGLSGLGLFGQSAGRAASWFVREPDSFPTQRLLGGYAANRKGNLAGARYLATDFGRRLAEAQRDRIRVQERETRDLTGCNFLQIEPALLAAVLPNQQIVPINLSGKPRDASTANESSESDSPRRNRTLQCKNAIMRAQ
jgi:hypothetical protein